MGTNYYRIPSDKEMEDRKERLQVRLIGLKLTPDLIESGFRYIENSELAWDGLSPWDEFTSDTVVHLGKRSMGWKFCWNFHDGEYYSTKQELLNFIKSGRVVDEYGVAEPVEEFIQMALTWGEPDGLVADAEYFEKNPHSFLSDPSKYYDKEIDGLRVSSSKDFS
jgi:hypothetical protein